jgi:glutaconate CoA-transferase subunit B
MKATPTEVMIAAAGRALAGVRTVFVGVGLPNSACNFARRTVAPDLKLIYESGVYGARPARIPLSIGDPALVTGAIAACSMPDLFFLYLQGGRVEVAFLGAAQIDRFGNINTTVIGDWDRPKVRLPGSGGACEIATHAERVFVIMRLRRRAFVERLDFHTSPGHLGGKGGRASQGLPGKGPELVVTDKCLLGFEQPAGEMVLQGLYPGVSVEEVQQEIGWALKVSDQLQSIETLAEEEIRLLRQGLESVGETK